MNSSDNRPRAIWGAEAIAEVLGLPLRKTYYLLEKELVPARKVGSSWQTTQGELEDFLLGRQPDSQQREVA
jgi:hypothetical protein